MSCDFKPGDEVVCIDDGPQWDRYDCPLEKGESYVVLRVIDHVAADGSSYSLVVGPSSLHHTGAWSPSRFRKVQRRTSGLTVESFLTIKPGQFEEPKRPVKAPKKEKAQ